MNDPIIFALGVAAGALAVFIPWVGPVYRKYVLNCGKFAGCPHHSPDNARRYNERRHTKPPTHIDH